MEEFDLFADDIDDVNTIVKTQESLFDTEQRLGAMLDAMPIGLLFHTQQGILYANDQACQLLRAQKSELVGRHFLDYIREAEFLEANSLLQSAFEAGQKAVETESVIACGSGPDKLIKITASRLPWEGTPVIQVLFQDITAQKRAEQSLRKLSITDELTGAFNRRHVFYEAESYLQQEKRPPVTIAMLDVDHFKSVNDTYGHALGDMVLKEITRLAHGFVPTISNCKSAMFARIGGEEFLFLLPGVTKENGFAIVDEFRRTMMRLRIPSDDGRLVSITASFGVAEYREEDKSIDKLLSRADAALYEAKANGRNQVCQAK
ncbi:sensor domain-containing diguanylate cyclase [Maritalea porphyrae]|uniref:sensor domain-containing diguanylate cyclase n=1 Tax=Maritalea porphyrae TaxID=880732 RepID=UPI0022AF7A2C|nr:sensor domain-containing diguanylate cyclase [Maritalea porphyrae]MCZ4273934.1 sensor domain-containing diguanylate cyclase [Maritalea porphyrae]